LEFVLGFGTLEFLQLALEFDQALVRPDCVTQAILDRLPDVRDLGLDRGDVLLDGLDRSWSVDWTSSLFTILAIRSGTSFDSSCGRI